MSVRQLIEGCFAAAALFLLLLNPSLSLSGARNGLLLWSNTVLPTLLPFMIFAGMIGALGMVSMVTGPFLPILNKLFGLSAHGSFVLLSGLLCGYPMGARLDSDLLDQGALSEQEAQVLLAVSCYPSPMFLLGYTAEQLGKMPGGSLPMYLVLLSLYLPAIPISFAARKLYHYSGAALFSEKRDGFSRPFSFDQHLMDCFDTMVRIGLYMMLFSILASWLTALPAWVPLFVRCLLTSACEMTTGIHLSSLFLGGLTGQLMILWAAAFGGLCGAFQTKSVLKNARLSIWHYILWKLAHSLLSCLCFYLILKIPGR